MKRAWCLFLQACWPPHFKHSHITCQHWQGVCWWCDRCKVGDGCNSTGRVEPPDPWKDPDYKGWDIGPGGA